MLPLITEYLWIVEAQSKPKMVWPNRSYGQLFRRIVQHLNLIAESPSAKSGTDLDIGILDVAGFGTYNRI